MTVLRTDDGRMVVPGNRWDLAAAAAPAILPRVSVVVPYFDASEDLSRLLAGLALQTYPHDLLDIVVADDGSPEPPRLEPTIGQDIPVTLVRQEDQGFRAAAARNLGVRASVGEVLCFLDQDVVPEPTYVERISRLCAVVPDALVVGRRRHADQAGNPLGDPEWLTEAYERTGNLLHADDAGFRFVISAVMTCGRALFDELGGFAETFTEYGGEDWEFAYRAWNAGAVLAHEPTAVAWHDGPDWAGRGTAEQRAREKATEQRTLAELIPDPAIRREPLPGAEIVDVCVLSDDPGLADRLGGGIDLAVFPAEPPPKVAAAARYRAQIHDAGRVTPEILTQAMKQDAGRVEVVEAGRPVLTLTTTRAARRAARWATDFPGTDLVEALFGVTEWASHR